MIRVAVVLMGLGMGWTAPSPAQKAAAIAPATLVSSQPGADSTRRLLLVPDSIRQRAGYHHWKGAAIGGALGALGGLVLALATHGQCDDCTSDTAPLGKVTLIGAGLGGAFGFLVGLASPRYRWVKASGE